MIKIILGRLFREIQGIKEIVDFVIDSRLEA